MCLERRHTSPPAQSGAGEAFPRVQVMASLAAIIAAQAEQDQQAAQAETELKLQRAHASVLESGSSEEADLALALLLSKQEAEKESGVRVASAIPLPFDHTYAPASTPRDGPEDGAWCWFLPPADRDQPENPRR